MKLITDLVQWDASAETPVYLQIANGFIHHIRLGRLRKGLKLPGSREMAGLLSVNRMTVVAALNELEAQGWIEMLPRKGTFVRKSLPLLAPSKIEEADQFVIPEKAGFEYDESKIVPFHAADFPPSGKINFGDGFPDVRLAPIEQLIKTMRSLSHLPGQRRYLMYGGAQGSMFLRQALSDFLNETRGLPVSPENILITRGAQMGLYLSGSIILDKGDHVIVGRPGYGDASLTLRQLGAKIDEVPVDEYGLDVDEVEKLCRRRKIRLVYVIPHHHHPTTVTLAPERRVKLLQLAAQYKFAILEDDYDYDFHYASKPIMPMASLDRHGHVIYIGTFTKTLAPAIRLGFIVAPANFIRHAVYLRKSIDIQGDSLLENAIAEWFKDGTIARHIKKSVNIYRDRRDHLCELLEDRFGAEVAFEVPKGGMSVWVKFLKNDLAKISERAGRKGLLIRDGRDYDTDKVKFNAVRLGFSSLTLEEQRRGVEILGECM
ncbi:MAG: PLP-dependent aminotransferase family protein [Imperialibacter sp.]|uniref:MocR-like pyridoxine biosynthesis transcription factor PdxR n=1 Tax=Imperialibacter sp. TaxID=2038411 RepID=UPI0032EFB163